MKHVIGRGIDGTHTTVLDEAAELIAALEKHNDPRWWEGIRPGFIRGARRIGEKEIRIKALDGLLARTLNIRILTKASIQDLFLRLTDGQDVSEALERTWLVAKDIRGCILSEVNGEAKDKPAKTKRRKEPHAPTHGVSRIWQKRAKPAEVREYLLHGQKPVDHSLALGDLLQKVKEAHDQQGKKERAE